MKQKSIFGQVILHIVFIALSLAFIVPFLYAVSISFSDEKSLIVDGYALIPHQFSVEAYRLLFKNPTQIIQSYKITAFYSIIATGFAMLVMAMLAYPMSRSNYKYRKFMTVYVLITMLFNAGMVPNYILITKYLHMDNTIWVYILPGVVSAWNLIVIRTAFVGVPYSLIEAGKLDGASEFYICFRIVVPLSMPTLAAVAFLFLVPKWNDWYVSLLYIQDTRLYSLQYVLQRILREAEFLKQMANSGLERVEASQIPSESFKYAVALVVAGPMLIAFPFFQKYFVKGVTIGAVKG